MAQPVPVDARPAILRFVEKINQHADRGVDGPLPVWPPEDVGVAPVRQAPDRMDAGTKVRLRTAAERATSLYPGPVGELLHQELLSWMIFGHHLGSTLIIRVADDLLSEPITRVS